MTLALAAERTDRIRSAQGFYLPPTPHGYGFRHSYARRFIGEDRVIIGGNRFTAVERWDKAAQMGKVSRDDSPDSSLA